MNQWEVLDGVTDRMKVDGGWIYRTVVGDVSESVSVAMVFVPDVKPDHG